jgi:Icc-related predicted phosphoesterase
MMRLGRGRKRERTRLFFATDIHGSERCFRKWLNAAEVYEVDALVLGGDVSGKTFVAVVDEGDGTYTASFRDVERRAGSEQELEELLHAIRTEGHYALVVDREERERIETDVGARERAMRAPMVDQMQRWTALADERLGVPAFAILGNDDPPELADILRASERITFGEGGVVELPGGYPMVSFGYSTPTPWNTPREMTDEQMAGCIEDILGQLQTPERAVWNFHCPPRDTHLDQAPRLDADLRPVAGGQESASVGSQAVRDAIVARQPLLGLHGHVHESAGIEKLGTTVCINPGSEYGQGVLRGVLVELEAERGVTTWQLMSG